MIIISTGYKAPEVLGSLASRFKPPADGEPLFDVVSLDVTIRRPRGGARLEFGVRRRGGPAPSGGVVSPRLYALGSEFWENAKAALGGATTGLAKGLLPMRLTRANLDFASFDEALSTEEGGVATLAVDLPANFKASTIQKKCRRLGVETHVLLQLQVGSAILVAHPLKLDDVLIAARDGRQHATVDALRDPTSLRDGGGSFADAFAPVVFAAFAELARDVAHVVLALLLLGHPLRAWWLSVALREPSARRTARLAKLLENHRGHGDRAFARVERATAAPAQTLAKVQRGAAAAARESNEEKAARRAHRKADERFGRTWRALRKADAPLLKFLDEDDDDAARAYATAHREYVRRQDAFLYYPALSETAHEVLSYFEVTDEPPAISAEDLHAVAAQQAASAKKRAVRRLEVWGAALDARRRALAEAATSRKKNPGVWSDAEASRALVRAAARKELFFVGPLPSRGRRSPGFARRSLAFERTTGLYSFRRRGIYPRGSRGDPSAEIGPAGDAPAVRLSSKKRARLAELGRPQVRAAAAGAAADVGFTLLLLFVVFTWRGPATLSTLYQKRACAPWRRTTREVLRETAEDLRDDVVLVASTVGAVVLVTGLAVPLPAFLEAAGGCGSLEELRDSALEHASDFFWYRRPRRNLLARNLLSAVSTEYPRRGHGCDPPPRKASTA